MTFADGRQGDLFAGPALTREDPGWDADARDPVAVGAWPRDCRNGEGYRPCPIVSCRHHLLLDLVYSNPTEPNLAINRARRPGALRVVRGRRPELSLDATRAEVDQFAADAVAALWALPDTCSREVARRARLAVDAVALLAERPEPVEAMTWDEVAVPLGVADPDELVEEFAAIRDGLRGEAIEAGADPSIEEDAVLALAGRFTRPG